VSTRLQELIRKRERLIAHAATQRAQVAELVESLHTPLAIADGAYRIAQVIRRHPAIAAAATVAMFAQTRQHRLLLWSGRLFSLWELYRSLREQWPRRERPPREAGGSAAYFVSPK
jgi:hypothetical protein